MSSLMKQGNIMVLDFEGFNASFTKLETKIGPLPVFDLDIIYKALNWNIDSSQQHAIRLRILLNS